MTVKALIPVLLALSTSACAQPPVHAEAGTNRPTASPHGQQSALPREPLTQQVLYQFLLGEIAGQRGELALASEDYVDLAHKTRDPRIAKRATEMAIYARRMDLATNAAHLWMELEPASLKAKQTYASLLISVGKLDEAKPVLEAVLKQDKRPVGETFMQLHNLLLRYHDKQAVLNLVSELASAYAGVPEAQFVVAQAAWYAGKYDQAAQALEHALRLRPGWQPAALFYGRILQRKGDDAVADYWKEFLVHYPAAQDVRMAYARQLARMGHYPEARAQFETMLKDMPDNPDVLVALGLLDMQMNDLDAAETHLKAALEHAGDDGRIKMYLGQLDEGRHKYEEALHWYRAVDDDQLYLEARLRAAIVLGKLKRVDEGRALLQSLTPKDATEKTQIIQAEAQMLREAGDLKGAYAVLTRGLDQMPDSPDLLYDHAMVAERLNRLDILEKDLRLLIKLRPNYAHAYNALGYTLADRTTRLAEAIKLLQKAIELAPNDPFIQDSMGWALFKAKRLDESISYLRRAYKARPDPEIAAHLGEALWAKGDKADKAEARQIWEGSIKEHPNNKSLRETLSRLHP